MKIKHLKAIVKNMPDEADVVFEKVIADGQTLYCIVQGCRIVRKDDQGKGMDRLVIYNHNPILKGDGDG